MEKELKQVLAQDFSAYKTELEERKNQLERELTKINSQLEAINNIIIIQNG